MLDVAASPSSPPAAPSVTGRGRCRDPHRGPHLSVPGSWPTALSPGRAELMADQSGELRPAAAGGAGGHCSARLAAVSSKRVSSLPPCSSASASLRAALSAAGESSVAHLCQVRRRREPHEVRVLLSRQRSSATQPCMPAKTTSRRCAAHGGEPRRNTRLLTLLRDRCRLPCSVLRVPQNAASPQCTRPVRRRGLPPIGGACRRSPERDRVDSTLRAIVDFQAIIEHDPDMAERALQNHLCSLGVRARDIDAELAIPVGKAADE